jgi:hypothetical protein
LQEHLTNEQIDRYVARTGDADEIIAIAEHLDACFDCRDRVAAIVDPGTGERPHRGAATRRSSGRVFLKRDPAKPSRATGLVPWILAAIIVAVIVLALVIGR